MSDPTASHLEWRLVMQSDLGGSHCSLVGPLDRINPQHGGGRSQNCFRNVFKNIMQCFTDFIIVYTLKEHLHSQYKDKLVDCSINIYI